jgi:hypothetical protein
MGDLISTRQAINNNGVNLKIVISFLIKNSFTLQSSSSITLEMSICDARDRDRAKGSTMRHRSRTNSQREN